jgi:hypothetical protein
VQDNYSILGDRLGHKAHKPEGQPGIKKMLTGETDQRKITAFLR